MKIAVTADLHLTAGDHPERIHALETILDQLLKKNIDTLIIAGDLFHESTKNAADFETLCRDPQHWGIRFIILPGNHDTSLNNRVIAAENVDVIDQPRLMAFGEGNRPILLIPYAGGTMGEAIAGLAKDLPPHEWVLIGHGDWVEGMREANPMEPGVYMPLTRTDIENFKPAKVILGHIHKPMDRSIVHYPGSPYPCDITETGKRRILLLNTENAGVEAMPLDTDIIYFDESIVVLPVENEIALVEKAIQTMRAGWNLENSDVDQICLRLKVSGYTADKRRLVKAVESNLKDVQFYQNANPDYTKLSVNEDIERAEIARRTAKTISELTWPETEIQPDKDQMLLEALRVIYGEK